MDREIYTPMFEDRTYENILDETMADISDEFDKREGSIIHDALAPASIEISLLYSYLDFLFKNAFGSTANRYWLIQRAKERGIEPYPATHSIIIGKFDVEIELQSRFFIDNVYFKVIKFVENSDGFYFYELQCEETGIIGNIKAGKLTPAQTIRDLKVAEIYKLAILGEEDEDTESFRGRYYESIKSIAYGGNIADYKNKVRAIDGVGLVKVIPVPRGGGTVDLIITDTEFNTPTPELVSKVQEAIDPVPFKQKGVGIAPIGHHVLVFGAKRKSIDITCNVIISNGADIEEIKKEIKGKIEEYFSSVRKVWADYSNPNLVNVVNGEIYSDNDIRLAKIMSIVLNAQNVVDYSEIKFTSSDSKIFVLERDEIPYIGVLNIEGVSI